MADWDRHLRAAQAAAREAGAMLRSGMEGGARISFKGAVDLVTEFDCRAQDLIVDRLAAAFPDHGFLAEEGLNRGEKNELCWVIDPLDGTTNFAHRFPIFAVSIALEHQGRVVLGVVYDPMREEIFHALEGGGAWLNGSGIRVSAVDNLDRSLLATGFPYDLRESPVNNIVHFNHFLIRAQAVRRCGSAALDLCHVACGRFDGFWELKLKPWDQAAGALIVEEAGGHVTNFEGAVFLISSRECLATNGLIHEAMIRILALGKEKPEDRGGLDG
ncbi:MAG: inositol monophosphatase [Candidatus Aminicenantes bacterium]|nr:inositol monophosphatase [Candidatus Aminicenantes bacterium]